MNIFLIRHGQIRVTAPRRFIGQLDLPLTPKGRLQMARVAVSMQPESISAIYTSPLQRARESAAIVAGRLGLTLHTEPDLNEINLGLWDGLSFAEVKQRFPGEYEKRGQQLAVYRTPGGESFSDLQIRSIKALDNIVQKSSGNILIVAHAGINRVLLCHFMGLGLARLFDIKQNYACINLIEAKDRHYHVLYTNRSQSNFSNALPNT